MRLEIITPERIVLSDKIDRITLMTENGEISILPHHIPFVSNLRPGEARYEKEKHEASLAIAGGFVVVREDGSVVILADAVEHPEEIDLTRAEAARARAAKLMSEIRSKEDVDFTALQMKLEKELNRIRVGNKYRKI